MTAQTLPDVAGAVRTRILAIPEVTALVGSKVAVGGINRGWAMPTQAVVLNESGGPLGLEDGGLRRQRIDVWCYGATGLEAATLWRTLDPRLVSRQGGGMAVTLGALIVDVMRASEMYRLREPETEWIRCWCSYFVLYSQVPR